MPFKNKPRIAVLLKPLYRHAMKSNQTINPIKIGQKAFIFGGAYGNLEATKAILEKADDLGFKRSEIIFTGDMAAYCANPAETSKLIREKVDHIIMGNCEEAIATGSDNCRCGFESGSTCSILSDKWYQFCLSKIDGEMAEWMGTLPRSLHVEISDKKFLVTHATQNSINEFIFPSNLQNAGCTTHMDGTIVGHSGLPFLAEQERKLWINSGASGMPANDGTPRVWYATIISQSGRLEAQTHALKYDFISARNAMRNAGLNNGYADCLETGIWPSHDVLPKVEKDQTGIELSIQKKALQRAPLEEIC